MLVETGNPHRCYRPVRDGMWVRKRKSHPVSGNTFRPWRDGGMNCAGYFLPAYCAVRLNLSG
ncbi:MAG: hypothetical protein LBB73_01910 [Dysgonamonadaceae bacterium]|nr:hypothetical protein [Dysgonamonadaceae bacterium]